MRRREFVAGLGSVATPLIWSRAGIAQKSRLPVIGFLSTNSLEADRDVVFDFRRGLRAAGYIEGQNVAIEFRWGNGQPVMRQLATDLVRLQVAVIVASGGAGALFAAKAATPSIPIVLSGGADPVKLGLVKSLNQPGGNITGITFLQKELEGKRLGLLLTLVPEVKTIGYIIGNEENETLREGTRELIATAGMLGRHIIVEEIRAVSDGLWSATPAHSSLPPSHSRSATAT